MKDFEKTMKIALIDAYGWEAWDAQTPQEKQDTLHSLFCGFLTAVKQKGGRI